MDWTQEVKDSGFNSVLGDAAQNAEPSASKEALLSSPTKNNAVDNVFESRVNGNAPAADEQDSFFSGHKDGRKEVQSVFAEDDLDKRFQDALLGNYIPVSGATDPFSSQLQLDKEASQDTGTQAKNDETFSNPFHESSPFRGLEGNSELVTQMSTKEASRELEYQNEDALHASKARESNDEHEQNVPASDFDHAYSDKWRQSESVKDVNADELGISKQVPAETNPFSSTDANPDTEMTVGSPGAEFDLLSTAHDRKDGTKPSNDFYSKHFSTETELTSENARSAKRTENVGEDHASAIDTSERELSNTNPFSSYDINAETDVKKDRPTDESVSSSTLLMRDDQTVPSNEFLSEHPLTETEFTSESRMTEMNPTFKVGFTEAGKPEALEHDTNASISLGDSDIVPALVDSMANATIGDTKTHSPSHDTESLGKPQNTADVTGGPPSTADGEIAFREYATESYVPRSTDAEGYDGSNPSMSDTKAFTLEQDSAEGSTEPTRSDAESALLETNLGDVNVGGQKTEFNEGSSYPNTATTKMESPKVDDEASDLKENVSSPSSSSLDGVKFGQLSATPKEEDVVNANSSQQIVDISFLEGETSDLAASSSPVAMENSFLPQGDQKKEDESWGTDDFLYKEEGSAVKSDPKETDEKKSMAREMLDEGSSNHIFREVSNSAPESDMVATISEQSSQEAKTDTIANLSDDQLQAREDSAALENSSLDEKNDIELIDSSGSNIEGSHSSSVRSRVDDAQLGTNATEKHTGDQPAELQKLSPSLHVDTRHAEPHGTYEQGLTPKETTNEALSKMEAERSLLECLDPMSSPEIVHAKPSAEVAFGTGSPVSNIDDIFLRNKEMEDRLEALHMDGDELSFNEKREVMLAETPKTSSRSSRTEETADDSSIADILVSPESARLNGDDMTLGTNVTKEHTEAQLTALEESASNMDVESIHSESHQTDDKLLISGEITDEKPETLLIDNEQSASRGKAEDDISDPTQIKNEMPLKEGIGKVLSVTAEKDEPDSLNEQFDEGISNDSSQTDVEEMNIKREDIVDNYASKDISEENPIPSHADYLHSDINDLEFGASFENARGQMSDKKIPDSIEVQDDDQVKVVKELAQSEGLKPGVNMMPAVSPTEGAEAGTELAHQKVDRDVIEMSTSETHLQETQKGIEEHASKLNEEATHTESQKVVLDQEEVIQEDGDTPNTSKDLSPIHNFDEAFHTHVQESVYRDSWDGTKSEGDEATDVTDSVVSKMDDEPVAEEEITSPKDFEIKQNIELELTSSLGESIAVEPEPITAGVHDTLHQFSAKKQPQGSNTSSDELASKVSADVVQAEPDATNDRAGSHDEAIDHQNDILNEGTTISSGSEEDVHTEHSDAEEQASFKRDIDNMSEISESTDFEGSSLKREEQGNTNESRQAEDSIFNQEASVPNSDLLVSDVDKYVSNEDLKLSTEISTDALHKDVQSSDVSASFAAIESAKEQTGLSQLSTWKENGNEVNSGAEQILFQEPGFDKAVKMGPIDSSETSYNLSIESGLSNSDDMLPRMNATEERLKEPRTDVDAFSSNMKEESSVAESPKMYDQTASLSDLVDNRSYSEEGVEMSGQTENSESASTVLTYADADASFKPDLHVDSEKHALTDEESIIPTEEDQEIKNTSSHRDDDDFIVKQEFNQLKDQPLHTSAKAVIAKEVADDASTESSIEVSLGAGQDPILQAKFDEAKSQGTVTDVEDSTAILNDDQGTVTNYDEKSDHGRATHADDPMANQSDNQVQINENLEHLEELDLKQMEMRDTDTADDFKNSSSKADLIQDNVTLPIEGHVDKSSAEEMPTFTLSEDDEDLIAKESLKDEYSALPSLELPDLTLKSRSATAEAEPSQTDALNPTLEQHEGKEYADSSRTEVVKGDMSEVSTDQSPKSTADSGIIGSSLQPDVEEAVVQRSSDLVASEPARKSDESGMMQDVDKLNSELLKMDVEELSTSELSSNVQVVSDQKPEVHLNPNAFGEEPGYPIDDINVPSEDKVEHPEKDAPFTDGVLQYLTSDVGATANEGITLNADDILSLNESAGIPMSTSYDGAIDYERAAEHQDFIASQNDNQLQAEEQRSNLKDPDLKHSLDVVDIDSVEDVKGSSFLADAIQDNVVPPNAASEEPVDKSNMKDMLTSTQNDNGEDRTAKESELPSPELPDLTLKSISAEGQTGLASTDVLNPTFELHAGQDHVDSSPTEVPNKNMPETSIKQPQTDPGYVETINPPLQHHVEEAMIQRSSGLIESEPDAGTFNERQNRSNDDIIISSQDKEDPLSKNTTLSNVFLKDYISEEGSAAGEEIRPDIDSSFQLYDSEGEHVTTSFDDAMNHGAETTVEDSDASGNKDQLQIEEKLTQFDDSGSNDVMDMANTDSKEAVKIVDDVHDKISSPTPDLDEPVWKQNVDETLGHSSKEGDDLMSKDHVDEYAAHQPHDIADFTLKSASDEVHGEPSQTGTLNSGFEQQAGDEHANSPQTEDWIKNEPNVKNNQPQTDIPDLETVNMPLKAGAEETVVQRSSEQVATKLTGEDADGLVIEQSMDTLSSAPLKTDLEEVGLLMQSSDKTLYGQAPEHVDGNILQAHDPEESVASAHEAAVHADAYDFYQDKPHQIDDIIIPSQDKEESLVVDPHISGGLVKDSISNEGATEAERITLDTHTSFQFQDIEGAPVHSSFEEALNRAAEEAVGDYDVTRNNDQLQIEEQRAQLEDSEFKHITEMVETDSGDVLKVVDDIQNNIITTNAASDEQAWKPNVDEVLGDTSSEGDDFITKRDVGEEYAASAPLDITDSILKSSSDEENRMPSQTDALTPTVKQSADQEHVDSSTTRSLNGSEADVSDNRSQTRDHDAELFSAHVESDVEEAIVQRSSEVVASEPAREDEDALVTNQNKDTLYSKPLKTEFEDLGTWNHSSDKLEFEQSPQNIAEQTPSDREEKVASPLESAVHTDTDVLGQDQTHQLDEMVIPWQSQSESFDSNTALSGDLSKEPITEKSAAECEVMTSNPHSTLRLDGSDDVSAITSFGETVSLGISTSVKDYTGNQSDDQLQVEDYQTNMDDLGSKRSANMNDTDSVEDVRDESPLLEDVVLDTASPPNGGSGKPIYKSNALAEGIDTLNESDEATLTQTNLEDHYAAPSFGADITSGSDRLHGEPSQQDTPNLNLEHAGQGNVESSQTETLKENISTLETNHPETYGLDLQTSNLPTHPEVQEPTVIQHSNAVASEIPTGIDDDNDVVMKQYVDTLNSETSKMDLEKVGTFKHESDNLNLDQPPLKVDEHPSYGHVLEEPVLSTQEPAVHSDLDVSGEKIPQHVDDVISPPQDRSESAVNDELLKDPTSVKGDNESERSDADFHHGPLPDSESVPTHTDATRTDVSLAEKEEIAENIQELFKANDLGDDDLAKNTVYDGKYDTDHIVKDSKPEMESHVAKRQTQDEPEASQLSQSLDQSIAPSWSGQIVAGDNPSEDWTSDNDYYEEFRLHSADQESTTHQQSSGPWQQPTNVSQQPPKVAETTHVSDTAPSVETQPQHRPEVTEDVVAVTTRMTSLEAERGHVVMTDVSSLMDAVSIGRPASSAFGTPPEDMPPHYSEARRHTDADATTETGSMDVHAGSRNIELENGRVTPDTLAADSLEEQEDQFDDGAELEYDEAIGESAWRMCTVGGKEQKIDMSSIEPYTKVLSHGGYMEGDSGQTIIVFAACHLPERSHPDYAYVMEHLFLYVLTTLDELVSEEYVLVYLHGGATGASSPTFSWLRRAYQLVDRRFRKTLKGLYLVHPSFWLRTIVALTRPFISAKFSRKLRYVDGLRELSDLIPMNHVMIPEEVKQVDFQLMIAERKKELNIK